MQQFSTTIEISTRGAGLYEFTRELGHFVGISAVKYGLLTAFCQHTSASLLIQENADADVRTDLDGFFRRLVPEGMEWIVHRTEGPDDMPAHARHVAGHLPLRAPHAAASAAGGAASHR